MKKLLIVACYFPPAGDVGAVRVTKMVKYLLRKGWDITVLTVKEEYHERRNDDWWNDVDGANIIRTPIFGPRILGKDIGTYWAPELYKSLCTLLKEHTFDMSIWTGNPFYHWCLASYCKKKYGLRYILDFRDPWKLHLYRWKTKSPIQLFKNAVDLVIANICEPIAVQHAERIINVNESLTGLYRRAYRKINPDKFLTITNGYDPEDMRDVQPIRTSAFDIVYAGKFYPWVDPAPFFQALKELIRQKNLTPLELRFIWIGPAEPTVRKVIDAYDLGSYVEMKGFMPYRAALKHMAGADACLFLYAFEGSTKVFDYMALNKPVLALAAADGPVRSMLEKYHSTYFSANNAEDILHALFRVREVSAAQPNVQKSSVPDIYSREYQASQLDVLLNTMSSSLAD